MKAKVYVKNYCPFCKKAEMMLSDAGIQYDEVDLTDSPEEYEKLKEKTGHMTIPQVFIDDEFIGGSDDLQEWLENHPDAVKEK